MSTLGMTLDEYEEAALRTAGERCKNEIMYGGLAVAGEAGEYADLVKKWEYHEVPFSREKGVKELGDVLWSLTAAAHSLGVSLQYVADENLRKLKERYPNGFVPGGGIRADV